MLFANSSKLFLLVVSTIVLGACSSTQSSTNKPVELNTSAVVSLKPNMEVRELIRGKGCSGTFLSIFKTGNTRFLAQSNIDTSTEEGKAKAAAAYNALYGDKDAEILTDVIVNPIFQTETRGVFFAKETCATVVGYRGVIVSWEKTSN
jgi:hypothetical protein